MARRNAKVGDLFRRRPDDEPWRFPFNDVKRDPIEGYFLDASGDLAMLQSAQTGDKVADFAISDRPYWEIKFVDESSGRIWVEPIGENPFLTGVGAGGARLTDYDWKALSGEAAKEDIDRALDDVSSRCVTEYRQLVPLLKGWVPPFMGPNGRQGGHYGSDWSYTIGAREGLSIDAMIAADAKAIQRFGIDAPPAVLHGEIDVKSWQRFISGYDDLEDLAGTELADEDWSNPDRSAAMVLGHPMLPIKLRNMEALMRLWQPEPREIEIRLTSPARWDDPEWVEMRSRVHDDVYDRWSRGEYQNEAVGQQLKKLALDVRSLSHPRCRPDDDVYMMVRVKAVKAARRGGWIDVLRAYETDPSEVVREEVANGWRVRGNEEALLRMESVETHPEALKGMLFALHQLGVDPLDLVDAASERYAAALSAVKEDSWLGTQARGLDDEIRAWRAKKNHPLWADDWQRDLARYRAAATRENPGEDPTHVGEDGRTSCCQAFTSISMDDQTEHCKKCFRAVDGYVGDAVYELPKLVDIKKGHAPCKPCSRELGVETMHPINYRCPKRRGKRQ